LKEADRMDIISLLLQVSLSDAKATGRITRSMYNALLNHPRLKEYWTALTEEGLLAFDDATQSFKTTEKGLRFLEVFNKLDRLSRPRQQPKEKKSNSSQNVR
jgi:predicted transcriptional regulator